MTGRSPIRCSTIPAPHTIALADKAYDADRIRELIQDPIRIEQRFGITKCEIRPGCAQIPNLSGYDVADVDRTR